MPHFSAYTLRTSSSIGTGDLMSRATNDLGAVRMMMGPAVMYTASTVLTFIVAIVLMISIDPWLTLVALVPLPFVTVVVKYFGDAIHTRFEKIQEQLSDISAIAQESLAGVRVVRAYGQEAFEIARFRAANEEYVIRNRALIRLQGFYFPSMGLLMGIGALLVLWLGSRRVVAGADDDRRAGRVQRVPDDARLADDRVRLGQQPVAARDGLVEAPARGPGRPTTRLGHRGERGDQSIDGAMEFRNLTFHSATPSCFTASRSESRRERRPRLSAATGSGKSTLLNLLPRLHEPPAGTVFIDGVDVRQIPLHVLRGAIGFVNQEPFLFSTTLAENIAFGRAAIRGSGIASLRPQAIARLDKDLAQFPPGLRDHDRRAWHHIVGRAEAACRDCSRAAR